MNCLHLLVLGLLLAVLTNVTASPKCPIGYKIQDNNCTDDDECEHHECGDTAVCYNTVGSYYCQCKPGYRAKSVSFIAETGQCKDMNECENNPSICGLNAVCYNNIGSYNCTCASGFASSNGQEYFNASQSVTCHETKKRSAPNGAGELQQFNPTLLTVLPVSLWILINYQ